MAIKVSGLSVGHKAPVGKGVGLLPGLIKVVGQPVLVRAVVRNSGNAPGHFEMNLGAPAFVRSGPLVVNANADTPVSIGWATGAVAPGTYTVTIQVNELTAQGVFVRNLGSENFPITLRPAPLFVVGSRVRWVVGGYPLGFLGTVTELGPYSLEPGPHGDLGWQYVVQFDPGQAGNPASGWFWEFTLRAA